MANDAYEVGRMDRLAGTPLCQTGEAVLVLAVYAVVGVEVVGAGIAAQIKYASPNPRSFEYA